MRTDRQLRDSMAPGRPDLNGPGRLLWSEIARLRWASVLSGRLRFARIGTLTGTLRRLWSRPRAGADPRGQPIAELLTAVQRGAQELGDLLWSRP